MTSLVLQSSAKREEAEFLRTVEKCRGEGGRVSWARVSERMKLETGVEMCPNKLRHRYARRASKSTRKETSEESGPSIFEYASESGSDVVAQPYIPHTPISTVLRSERARVDQTQKREPERVFVRKSSKEVKRAKCVRSIILNQAVEESG